MNRQVKNPLQNRSYEEFKAFEYSKSMIIEITEAFEYLVSKPFNCIYRKDIKVLMLFLGFNPTDSEIERLCDQWEIDEDKHLLLNDILEILKVKYKMRDNQAKISTGYKTLLGSGTGKVDYLSIMEAASKLKLELTEDDAKDLIATSDIDKDGFLGEEDFKKIMGLTHMYY